MILEFMRSEHRNCDACLAAAEQSLINDDLEKAKAEFGQFKTDTLRHFEMEEEVLFPVFEARTGMTQGPTQVMRMEHEQVRGLLEKMEATIARSDRDAFFGIAESMMILLQQHNMKEEQMLYPMCDRALGADGEHVISEMKAL